MRTQQTDYSRTRSSRWVRTRDRRRSPVRSENENRRSLGYVSRSDLVHSERRMMLGEGLGSSRVENRDYDKHFERDRDGQLQKLSQFNEGSSYRDSPSMKFQWKNLLEEPACLNSNANPNLKHFSRYGVESTRMSTKRELGGSGVLDLGKNETVKFSVERARPVDVGVGKSSVQYDRNFLSPMKNLNMGLCNDEDSRIQDLQMDRTPMELYKNDKKHMLKINDSSSYMMPSSHCQTSAPVSSGIIKNNYDGIYSNLHTSLCGTSRTHGLYVEPVVHDRHACFTSKSFTSSELQVKDAMNAMYVQVSPTEAKSRDYAHPERERTETRALGTLTDEVYGNMTSAGESYAHQDILRTSIVDSIADTIDDAESFYRDHLEWKMAYEHACILQEQSTSNYLDADAASHSLKKGGEILGSGFTNLGDETTVVRYDRSLHETENYQDHRRFHETQIEYHSSPQTENYYNFNSDDGWRSNDKNLSRLPMSNFVPGLYGSDDGARGSLTEELGLLDPSENRLERRREVGKKLSKHKPKGQLSTYGDSSIENYMTDGNEQLTDEGMNCMFLPKKFGRFPNRKGIRSSTLTANHRNGRSTDCLSSHYQPVTVQCKSQTLARRDIKKRFKPGPQIVSNTSLGDRRPNKFQKRGRDDFCRSSDVLVGNPLEAKAIPAKIDPPEDSRDFKKLVDNAFLKFVRQLNESPAQRRRYTEQGWAGFLKCSVCGSKSEFRDTQSLATHAFKSLKVGFRSQHLGFHKALCVLLGWNSAVAPNSSMASQALPEAEALSLKEDLVIWPPVVIIHNSSIRNSDPDKRMIVSIEMLETILRDMGFFGGEKIKVCRGKPANQSIMVVRFTGTLSGLQEAEMLHKLYAESQHGKAQFQPISSDDGDHSSEEQQSRLAAKAEKVLYGYLGIAEDLDKLDFETKKRSVVKSKKEIQAIADAPLKAE